MDRRVTEILVGEGMTGKTSELIKHSAESGIYILVANRRRAEILVSQARDMKLNIPFPVTLQEWLRSKDRFHGSSIRRDGLLIDDIYDVIKELFFPIDIKAVSLRTPYNVKNLDESRKEKCMTKSEAIALEALCEKLISQEINTSVQICMNLAGRLKVSFDDHFIVLNDDLDGVSYINFCGFYTDLLHNIEKILCCVSDNEENFKKLLWSYENRRELQEDEDV